MFYLFKFLLSFHELYFQVTLLFVSLLLLLLSFDDLFPLSLLKNLLQLRLVLRSQAPVREQ